MAFWKLLGIIYISFKLAVTPANFKAGFLVTGIFLHTAEMSFLIINLCPPT